MTQERLRGSGAGDPSPLQEGQQFGRLTVVGFSNTVAYGHSKTKSSTRKHRYHCLCSCGNRTIVYKESLLRGTTKSCGCLRKEKKINSRKRDRRYDMWSNAKRRSRENDLEFSIDLDDIIIPEYCPALGIKLQHNVGSAGPDSPSLDRFDNSKGYTPDNIWVISYKANEIKNRYSYEELKAVVTAMEVAQKDGNERKTVERNKKKEVIYDTRTQT